MSNTCNIVFVIQQFGTLCHCRIYPYLPHGWSWECPRGGGGGWEGGLKRPKFPKGRRCQCEIIFPEELRQNLQ